MEEIKLIPKHYESNYIKFLRKKLFSIKAKNLKEIELIFQDDIKIFDNLTGNLRHKFWNEIPILAYMSSISQLEILEDPSLVTSVSFLHKKIQEFIVLNQNFDDLSQNSEEEKIFLDSLLSLEFEKLNHIFNINYDSSLGYDFLSALNIMFQKHRYGFFYLLKECTTKIRNLKFTKSCIICIDKNTRKYIQILEIFEKSMKDILEDKLK